MLFSDFNLCDELIKATVKANFISPTQVQQEVIPLVLQKSDILVKAQTGSGKSASFILPILQHFATNQEEGKAKIKTLVLAPTRELAVQIADTFAFFSQFLKQKPKIVCVIGGEHIGEQLLDLQSGCNIVVATSGRLLDIIDKKQINLANLDFFVLDEADKMLDLGFADELDMLLQILPKKRQNLMFSATYPQKILEIASKITKNPIKIEIISKETSECAIIERAIEVDTNNRGPLLRYLLETEKWGQTLVFMANKRAADNIAAKFRKHGFNAESFHGDLTQEERTYTLTRFKNKKTNILFSSDITARGIDIQSLPCVVNFDLPRSPTDYIHRIGRTGRAGKSGVAISFITQENSEHFKLIEKKCKIKLAREQIQDFEPNFEAEIKPHCGEPIKGKRKSKKDKARELIKEECEK